MILIQVRCNYSDLRKCIFFSPMQIVFIPSVTAGKLSVSRPSYNNDDNFNTWEMMMKSICNHQSIHHRIRLEIHEVNVVERVFGYSGAFRTSDSVLAYKVFTTCFLSRLREGGLRYFQMFSVYFKFYMTILGSIFDDRRLGMCTDCIKDILDQLLSSNSG